MLCTVGSVQYSMCMVCGSVLCIVYYCMCTVVHNVQHIIISAELGHKLDIICALSIISFWDSCSYS